MWLPESQDREGELEEAIKRDTLPVMSIRGVNYNTMSVTDTAVFYIEKLERVNSKSSHDKEDIGFLFLFFPVLFSWYLYEKMDV